MTGTRPPAVYEIDDLVVDLHARTQTIRAVDGASLRVHAGETVAIVGESGSGKTVMTMAPLGLLPEGIAATMRGTVTINGRVLAGPSSKDTAAICGKEIGVIFQDPMSALNPMHRIGRQIAEQARRHTGLSAGAARQAAIGLLRRVGIADPEDRYERYPHELSGGMLQRVMIAVALAGRPGILIADEPTTALDATVQAQILDLLKRIQRDDGLAVILITHDIGVVAGMADRVIVMYAGRIVEEGTAIEVLTAPAHPYTQGLLGSVPDLRRPTGRSLFEIPGVPPDVSKLAPGCLFALRCQSAVPTCKVKRPDLAAVSPDHPTHRAACPVLVPRQETVG